MNNNKRVITDTLSTRDEVTGYFIFILLFGFLLFMGFYAWPKAPIVSCWLWLMCLICIAAYLLNRSRSVCWFSLEGDVLRYRKLGFSEQRALSFSDIRKIAIDNTTRYRTACVAHKNPCTIQNSPASALWIQSAALSAG